MCDVLEKLFAPTHDPCDETQAEGEKQRYPP